MTNEYYEASRREIPVPLMAGAASVIGPNHAVWVSDVGGYSTGITLNLNAVISPKLAEEVGVAYPVFGDDVPEDGGPGTITVVAETPGHRYKASDGTLVRVGARASDRLAQATYWIPEHPTSLVVRVDWPSADLGAGLRLAAEGWRSELAAITQLW